MSSGEPAVLATLSSDQIEHLNQFSSEWFNATREGAPNRKETNAALESLYERGKGKPPLILYCQSPFQLIATIALIEIRQVGGEDLYRRVVQELKDDLWRAAVQNLEAQIAGQTLPAAEPDGEGKFDTNGVLGADSSVKVQASLYTIKECAKKEFAEKLSLQVKLKMRSVLHRRPDDAARGALALLRGEFPLIRAQFGLIGLEALAGTNVRKGFVAQLSPDVLDELKNVCNTKLSSKQSSLFGFMRKPEPLEILFESVHDHFRPPASGDMQAIGFVHKYLPVEMSGDNQATLKEWMVLKESAFHLELRERIAILCELPLFVHTNERNQLHNETGPAMEFADGYQLFAWNGVIVPREAIMDRGELTVAQIDKEQNVEVRRVLIQQYGMAKYLEDSGAVEVDRDECGVLYRKDQQMDEPIAMVKVINDTPEPDGTRKFYFLRVPPHITTARAAVAWTFNMKAEEYEPSVQS